MKKNKEKFVDDGRTIADMNIEGMRWYNPAKSAPTKETPADSPESKEPLGLKETFAIMRGVLGAGMLIALVFVVVFLLFILFCVFIWFK